MRKINLALFLLIACPNCAIKSNRSNQQTDTNQSETNSPDILGYDIIHADSLENDFYTEEIEEHDLTEGDINCQIDSDCEIDGSCDCNDNMEWECHGFSGRCIDGFCETLTDITPCHNGCFDFGCFDPCEDRVLGFAEDSPNGYFTPSIETLVAIIEITTTVDFNTDRVFPFFTSSISNPDHNGEYWYLKDINNNTLSETYNSLEEFDNQEKDWQLSFYFEGSVNLPVGVTRLFVYTDTTEMTSGDYIQLYFPEYDYCGQPTIYAGELTVP